MNTLILKTREREACRHLEGRIGNLEKDVAELKTDMHEVEAELKGISRVLRQHSVDITELRAAQAH